MLRTLPVESRAEGYAYLLGTITYSQGEGRDSPVAEQAPS